MDTLGKRIVHHRKRLGLTQDQLAEKLGVTAQAVSKWENDQSCPDITILPRLADIFGITTDALLGRSEPVYQAEVVSEEKEKDKPIVNIHWDGGRKSTFGVAVWVLAVGTLYLLSQLLSWGMSFWDVLWPTSMLVFGLFNIWPKFSFFSMGCVLLGGYFLTQQWLPLPEDIDGGVIWAAVILLFGVSLLIDALRKPKKTECFTYEKAHGKATVALEVDDENFEYNASFTEDTAKICLQKLESGEANCTFGNYILDLTGVESVSEDCRLELNCSFGKLTLLVPGKFYVKTDNSAAVGSLNILGRPDDQAQGRITLEANCMFCNVEVQYVS